MLKEEKNKFFRIVIMKNQVILKCYCRLELLNVEGLGSISFHFFFQEIEGEGVLGILFQILNFLEIKTDEV